MPEFNRRDRRYAFHFDGGGVVRVDLTAPAGASLGLPRSFVAVLVPLPETLAAADAARRDRTREA